MKLFIVIVFLFPKVNLGQAFTLGTITNFVLYTSNGAIANTGNSILTGGIGSDVGAISGFGTATVTGFFHSSDAVTAPS